MTFLQPLVLFGLPLVLVPIVIHLLNRMRHRPKPWAAMRFLVSATRSSVSQTRLRQFLILLFRVLAVLMLLLFLARPLAGGWVGWALSPAPDAIIILLDRSASMETQAAGISKREQALRLLAQAAKPFERKSHLVLIDSATRVPQEMAQADVLPTLSAAGPSDTAADIPAMLRAAFDWLLDNRAGAAEIWIASDDQRSNWLPDDPRWKGVIAQLAGLSQKVRVRLLQMDQPSGPNASIALREITRRPHGAGSELDAVLDIQRNQSAPASVPLILTLDGQRSESTLAMDSQSLRWRRQIDLGPRREGGWGSFSLPSDANNHDNACWFVYGPDVPLRAAVIPSDPAAAPVFQFAAAGRDGGPAEKIAPADFANAPLDGKALLIWQAPLPFGGEADRLQGFLNQGGVVIFFPPGVSDARRFAGLGWGDIQNSDSRDGYRILRWSEDEGPLARSDEHASLPLDQTQFLRRQLIAGQKNALAAFEDGSAFLVRQDVGKGQAYFCASLPEAGWSSLADGPVLVPMLQRLLLAGGRRLQQVSSVACGELDAADGARQWTAVDSVEKKDIHTQAGVYRSGDRMLAVNRPAAEDDPEIVSSEQARALFGALPVQLWREQGFATNQLQGEIWRVFVFAMLVFLIAEGVLMLPVARKPSPPARTKPKIPEEQPA